MTDSIDRIDRTDPVVSDTGASEEVVEAVEIRAEIEATREEMSGTLGAIGERLDPNRVVSQAKEAVRDATIGRVEDAVGSAAETARGAGITMWDTIRQNPIPAAMAGIGIVWLWQSRSGNENQRRRDGYRADYAAYGSYRDGYAEGGETGSRSPIDTAAGAVGQVKDTAGDVAGQVAGTVGDGVGQVAGTVQSTAGQIAGSVQGIATQAVWQAQGAVQQTSTQLRRMMNENPLALGAVATGVGVAVGLLVPETPQEHRLMGEARDTVAEKAQEVVNETMDKVREVTDKAESAVMEKAEEQGLAPVGAGAGSAADASPTGGEPAARL